MVCDDPETIPLLIPLSCVKLTCDEPLTTPLVALIVPLIEPVTTKSPDTYVEPDMITLSCLNCKGVFVVFELFAIRKSILFNPACASCPVWILWTYWVSPLPLYPNTNWSAVAPPVVPFSIPTAPFKCIFCEGVDVLTANDTNDADAEPVIFCDTNNEPVISWLPLNEFEPVVAYEPVLDCKDAVAWFILSNWAVSPPPNKDAVYSTSSNL